MLRLLPHGARRLLLATLSVAAVLGLSALAAGCDSNDDSSRRFIADVNFLGEPGGLRLEGSALFSTDDDDGPFALELRPRSEPSGLREGLLLVLDQSGLPSTGSPYSVTTPEGQALPSGRRFAGALRISFDGSVPALYYATDGVVDFRTSAADNVSGRFDVDATLVAPGGTVDPPFNLNIEGEFRAGTGPTDNFPFLSTAPLTP